MSVIRNATFFPIIAKANADVEGGKRSSQGITRVTCCTEALCNSASSASYSVLLAVGICSAALLFAELGGLSI